MNCNNVELFILLPITFYHNILHINCDIKISILSIIGYNYFYILLYFCCFVLYRMPCNISYSCFSGSIRS